MIVSKDCLLNNCQNNVHVEGDSAYRSHPWMMTPVLNPASPSEERYNQSHISTRNVIERTFGILKSRFRVLDRTGGALLYGPEKICQIVVACYMLHNIAVRSGMPNDMVAQHGGENDDPPPLQAEDGREDGRQTRDELIRTYFS